MSTRANPVRVILRRRFDTAGSARNDGFTLVEVLLTVAIVSAIVVPVMAWLLLTINKGSDLGQQADTAGFAHISRFLTRDVATADAVDAPASPGGTISSQCVGQAATAGQVDADYFVWLQTSKLEDDGSITEANYVTDESPDSGGTRLLRTTCSWDSNNVLNLGGTDELADNLRDQPAGASTAPVLVQCAPRTVGDPEPCGKITMSVRGAKAGSVSLEAARRVDPQEDGTAAVRAVIQCDPAGCQGFRQHDDKFFISFDGSLSTAPLGIKSFEWSFAPVGGVAPHPPILPGGTHPLDGSVIGPRGLETTPVLNLTCGPDSTPDAWMDDVGTGNPGCIYRVQLKVYEDNGSIRHATASADIVIENSSPNVFVTPNPVEAYRAIPVVFSTDGTVDPDGAPDGNDLTYQWVFGDGTTSDQRTPTHTVDGVEVPGHMYRCPAGTSPPANPEDVWCALTTTLSVSDEYSTVTETIPVNVRNAPPVVTIRGATTVDAPDRAATWSATYNPADPSASDVYDPDGNDQRDGIGPVDPATYRWSLVSDTAPNFEPVVQLGGDEFSVCSPPTSGCLPFGSYTLTLQVTDRDGLMVTSQSVIKVNTRPIAKARSKKGDGAWSTSGKVYSPKSSPSADDPLDDPITLDGSLSYDPDQFDRPGVPADPNAVITTWKWRVWGGSDWSAPATWTACSADLANEIANKRACEIVAAGPEHLLAPELWPARTYRIALAVVDNNNTESPCAEASPWTNSCVQSTDPSDGPWWQQVRINARPTVPDIIYSTPAGTLASCAPDYNFNPWRLCRTTPYTFEPKPVIADDRDDIDELTFQWSVPSLGTANPPTVVNGQTASATYPLNGDIVTTLRNGTLRLTVTDQDGAARVVTKDLRLVNHPPITQIVVEQASQNLGTWTTATPGSDPYLPTLVSNTQGDPDGDITSRSWTIRRYDLLDKDFAGPVLETYTVTWNGGACTFASSTASMQFSPGAGHEGCNRIDGVIDDWGRYRVSVTEGDNDGGSSSDTKDLLVLKPPVARITVLESASNCNNVPGNPAPFDPRANPSVPELPKQQVDYSPFGSIPAYRFIGPVANPNNVNQYTPCLFPLYPLNPGQPLNPALDLAKSSHDGAGGEPSAYKWTFHHDNTVDFDPALMFNTFNRCSGWTVGAPLLGCFHFPITLEVQNEAGYPAETTFLLRFNAQPVGDIGVPPASPGRSNNANWIRIPYCPVGCSLTVTGRDDVQLEKLSFDPDGQPDRKTSVPIANGSYAWTTGISGAVPTTPANQRDYTLTLPGRGWNQENYGSISLRVTDDEGYQSVNKSKNVRMNQPPQVGVPAAINSAANRNVSCATNDSPVSPCTFKVGPGDPYIPDGISAPIQAVVPEASPKFAANCGLPLEAETVTDFGWTPIPGFLPADRPATAHYEWTIQHGANTIQLFGVSDVTCKVNAFLHGSGVNATIASSPPVTLNAADGATATVTLKVIDTDGDPRVLTQVIPVRSPDPTAVIQPVAPTPDSPFCQLAITDATTGSGPTSEDCTVWSTNPPAAQAFTLTSAASSTPDGTPISSRSWRLLDSAFGNTNVTATSGCGPTTGVTFSCTLPANAGVYRAELTVTAGARTSRAVYYLKQNKLPQPLILDNPVIERGKTFTFQCTITDADSRITSRSFEIVRGAEVLFSSATPCSGSPSVVQGSIPASVLAGPATARLTATDVEGGVAVPYTQTVTITNFQPIPAITVSVAGQPCSDPMVECVAKPGQQVSLSGSATVDPDGPPGALNYSWVVSGPDGNQNYSGANPPAFTVNTAGFYNVVLTVTDPDGASGVASKAFRVNETPQVAMLVDGAINPSSVVVPRNLPTTFDLSANVTDPDAPFTYSWLVTDPNDLEVVSATTATVDDVPLNTHGDYTVRLTVTDSRGGATTITRIVRANQAPTASIAVLKNGVGCTATGLVGCVANAPFSGGGATTVVAQGSGTDPDGTVALYQWEVLRPGEATWELLQPVSADVDVDLASELETYGEGQYQIRLTTFDNVNTPSTPAVAVVTHNPVPTVEFPSGDIEAPRGEVLNVVVDAEDPSPGTGPLEYSWTLEQNGNPVVAPSQTSFPVFSAPILTTAQVGPAVLTVTVTDVYGATATATKTIDIVNSDPTVSIEVDPANTLVTAPSATYTFTAVEDDLDGTIISRTWEVTGPGGTETLAETGPVLTHTLDGYGDYTVTVTSTDDLGGTGTAPISIRLNQPPTAVIEPLAGTVLLGVPVAIDGSDSTDDHPLTDEGFLWTVDSGPDVDGVEIDLTDPRTPLFTFNTTGTYVVSLRVFDDDGASSSVVTTSVEVVA